MTRTEQLISCLAEEAVEVAKEAMEVAQRATKALRFGLQEIQPGQPLTNAERIGEEITDLLAVVEMLREAGAQIVYPEKDAIDRRAIELKRAKVEKFLKLSEACGTLEVQR